MRRWLASRPSFSCSRALRCILVTAVLTPSLPATAINQLSGGIKVKVVLAVVMWQNPLVLLLDEPTNDLNREGSGALVLAVKDYKGGVPSANALGGRDCASES